MRLKLHVRYVSSVCKYKLYVYMYYILGNVEYNIKFQKIVLVDFECLLQAGKSMFNRGVVSRLIHVFPDMDPLVIAKQRWLLLSLLYLVAYSV